MKREPGQGFVGAATEAFLRRRIHRQRMRLAAMRVVRSLASQSDDRLWVDFDHSADLFTHAAPWLASYAADTKLATRHRRPADVPKLTVVILVVGTRGDVQPFLPIARKLAERHRVRIASHAEFREMVEKAEVEFYPLAGDPRELVEYLARTGGRLVPIRIDALVEDVPKKRALIGEILESTWRACTEPDPDRSGARPFAADWIIANPPSFGHIHCAEALDVPLHMVFTMPWTATSAFPHPLTRLQPGEHRPVRNFLSYGVVSTMLWAGLGDVVNGFRERTLGLAPLDPVQGASLLEDNEVPFTYLFPESVIPRPEDWGPHIDLTNFIFANEAANYEPPPDLAAFLAAGPPPVYVGFGSTMVPAPAALTRVVFEGLERAGVRGVLSRGWGELGGEAPPHVHIIDDCPHDWLFPRCQAVCHHGGAGTTAAGLRAGLPSVVVPFFGDQFFWGRVIADAGAGPEPVPAVEITSESLAEAFAHALTPDARAKARLLGARVRERDGVDLVTRSLYRHLPVHAMRCANDASHLATVYCEPCRQRLCEECGTRSHAGHRVHGYRFVDWSVRPERTVSGTLRGLIADAAQAVRAGLNELVPLRAARRGGVVHGVRDRAIGGRSARGATWKAPGIRAPLRGQEPGVQERREVERDDEERAG
jgi:sterol 3beta-glucosyltransferase